jgi:membrane-associated protease RseP (regulator of RpoE activity)
VQIATPPVMIGVQLLDPDSSIRGHLGLKENEATMVGAVYEGLPAALAGLEPYDIIIGVGDKTAAPPATVREALRTTETGKSVSLKVLHRGQEKTVTITPEKYDGEKLDKAKINAIAGATNTPNANMLASGIDPEVWVQAFGGNGQPFVATTPGKPMAIWGSPFGGAAGGQGMNDFAKRMQEMAEQMRTQAESARRDAERLHEQLRQQQGGAAPAAGPGMDDRMKKREEMLQKLMEQREKKGEDKSDSRSLRTLPARDVCTWRPAPGSFRV